MAVRPIDASRFGEILEQWKKDCLQDNDTQGADIISDVILQLDDMPTLTQPNEPLTLEQLREMDGEPVWIVEHPDWGHWELSADAEDYIADRDQDLYGLQHDDPAGQCGLHVLGWLAYRRPPEGEEDT